MIVIVAIYIGMLLLFLKTRKEYQEVVASIDRKEHPLYPLYPMALFIARFFDKEKGEGHRKRMEKIRQLYVNEDIPLQYQLFVAKKFAILLFCILLFNSLGACLLLTNQKQSIISNGTMKRPSYGEASYEVGLDVTVRKEDDYVKDHVSISVLPRQYTKETFDSATNEAKSYLEKTMLGNNKSFDQIQFPLNLISSIPNTALSVQWQFDHEDWIGTDGTIHNQGLTEPKQTVLTATMKGGEFKKEFQFWLTILPEQLSEEEALRAGIEHSLAAANEDTVTEEELRLPREVGSHQVYFEESSKDDRLGLVLFAVLVLVLLYLMMEQQLMKRKEERDLELMLDYPELINKFTLLIGAGMTVKKAWAKIVMEYEERKEQDKANRRYAYEELKVTLYELNNGVAEGKAYEAFGRRMQLMPYMKFASLLAQNVTKGMDGVLAALELEALNAFEDRKELAKRLGEKAGTKLLFPMGIMFCLVMAMIIVPAMHMM